MTPPSLAPLPLPSPAPLPLPSPASKPLPKRSSKPLRPSLLSPSREFQKWWESKSGLTNTVTELGRIRVDLDQLAGKRKTTKAQLFKAQSTLRCLRVLRTREGSLISHSEKELIYECIELKKSLGADKWEQFKEKWRATKRKEKEERKRRLKEGGKPDLTNLDRESLDDAIYWYRHKVHRLEKSWQTTAKAAQKTAMWEETWLGKVEVASKKTFTAESLKGSRSSPLQRQL